MKKALLTIVATLLSVAFVPAIASAAPAFTDVTGTIYYNGVHVGKGVLVTVTCKGNVLTDKTNKSGVYLVQFSKKECPVNAKITVTATVNGDKGKSTGKSNEETTDLNLAIINVDVPELGLVTGLAALTVGAGATLMIRRRHISGNRA
jgi:hypothetical protein